MSLEFLPISYFGCNSSSIWFYCNRERKTEARIECSGKENSSLTSVASFKLLHMRLSASRLSLPLWGFQVPYQNPSVGAATIHLPSLEHNATLSESLQEWAKLQERDHITRRYQAGSRCSCRGRQP